MRLPSARRCAGAIVLLTLASACDSADGPPLSGTDPTPTAPSSAPLPSVDSAPGGGGGGLSAGDPIGTGQP